jgi:glycosyltransferase involved in cell wall biosynthesis
MSHKTIIVMPAYNAEATLAETVSRIPAGAAAELVVVDDASSDRTAEVAQDLPVTLLRHDQNRGYGGNQKTCYDAALERGADFVVMLHPDGQYEARLIPAAVAVLEMGVCDVVLGNRIRTRREALDGGMPRAKYFANRALTLIENVLTGHNLGEWHSGFRAYRRQVLETVPYRANSDGFVFDSQFLLQAVHFGFRLGDLPMPVRYFEEASSIGLGAASRYALATLWTFFVWYRHRLGLVKSPLFAPRSPAA